MKQRVRQHSQIPFEIFTVDTVFSDEELAMFDGIVEGACASTCADEDGCRPFTSVGDFKNGKMKRPEVAALMYKRLEPFLPATYIDGSGSVYTFQGACNHIMFAVSKEGQKFNIHTDTGCEYDETYRRLSKHTVLIYLNDDFEGGETVFYDNNFRETCRIQPKKGRVLVFDINLYHAGSVVRQGVKRWIGTELVCGW
jgi:hypothetical protein